MFKFSKKKKIDAKKIDKKKEYALSDLVLFGRNRDRAVYVEEDVYKNIKNDKFYCFIGIYNNDRTKVKDVITGEEYPVFRTYGCLMAQVNDERFSEINTDYIKVEENTYYKARSFYSLSPNDSFRNNDIYHLDTYFFDYGGLTYDFITGSGFATAKYSSLKNWINSLNEHIHDCYLSQKYDYDNALKEKARYENIKATYDERNF